MPSVVPTHHSCRLLTYITIEQQALGCNAYYMRARVRACVRACVRVVPACLTSFIEVVEGKKELCHV